MTTDIQTLPADSHVEIQALADELAKAYRKMVAFYIRECGLSRKEAIERTDNGRQNPDWIEQILEMPAQQISWNDMMDLREHDEAKGLTKWEEIKRLAQEYYETGQFSASTLDDTSPWQRAKYLGIRAGLAEGWQPCNGIEESLIDQMALCLFRIQEWHSALSRWMGFAEFIREQDKLPRVTTHEAVSQSAEMIDRFNRMFLRTLRSLRDLRRYHAPVIVQNAGQVNVGAQQVNVAPANAQPVDKRSANAVVQSGANDNP